LLGIGQCLAESRNITKLKDKINILENKIKEMKQKGDFINYSNNLVEQSSIDSKNNSSSNCSSSNSTNSNCAATTTSSTTIITTNHNNNNNQLSSLTSDILQVLYVYDIVDNQLLTIFSYLQTIEVLSVTQICKYMYQRVDLLFSIDSNIIQLDWKIRPINRNKITTNNSYSSNYSNSSSSSSSSSSIAASKVLVSCSSNFSNDSSSSSIVASSVVV